MSRVFEFPSDGIHVEMVSTFTFKTEFVNLFENVFFAIVILIHTFRYMSLMGVVGQLLLFTFPFAFEFEI